MPLLPEGQDGGQLDATLPSRAAPYTGVNQDQPIGGVSVLLGAAYRRNNLITKAFDEIENPLGSINEPGFDVTADGKRFVMVRREKPPPSQLSVITGLFDNLKP